MTISQSTSLVINLILLCLALCFSSDALAVRLPFIFPSASVPTTTASIVPARTVGIAPLSVFFDATGSASDSTTEPFHELQYSWTFDDPAGDAAWGYGAALGSKNYATGPVTAHVFETAGTYTVTLNVYNGTDTATATQVVTVLDPNSEFSGTSTICIGASAEPVAGVDGCPSGAEVHQQSNFATAINTYAATGVRLLFKHDDVFTATANAVISSAGPGIVGMYGVGAKPIIRSTAPNVVRFGAPTAYTMRDWRVMDLEIDGQSTAGVVAFGINGVADQITLLRVDVHDIGDGVLFSGNTLEYYMATNGYDEHMFDQITVVDSTFDTFLTGYGMFIFADRLAIMGNLVNDTTAAYHPLRIMHSAKGVVSNNTIGNPGTNYQAFTLRAPSYTDTGIPGEYFPNLLPGTAALTTQTVVSDNHFISGNTAQPVTVQPSNRDSWDGRFSDIILERNWYTTNGAACCSPMLNIQAQDVTVRNELIDMTGGTYHSGIGVVNAGTHSIASDNVKLYNNTIFSNDSGTFYGVTIQVGTSNTSVVNNLAYSPNVSGSFIRPGYDSPTIESNNTATTNTSPNMATVPPTTPAGFAITAGSYAIGAGAAIPVWSDFYKASRSSPYDIGAINH